MKEKIFGNQRFFLTFTAVFFFLIIGAIIFANMIWAADPVNVEYQVKFADLQSGDFLPQYINKIYKWLIMAGLFLVGVMIVVGGAMYLSSAGDKGTITKGKQYIVNSLIGLLLLASSYVILFTINPDAVQLDDFEIKAVPSVTKNCPCNSNGACPLNTFCLKNPIPFNPRIQSDTVQGFQTFLTSYVGVAVASVVVYYAGVKLMASGANAFTSFQASAKAFFQSLAHPISAIKQKFAFIIKNPGAFLKSGAKTVAGDMLISGGLALGVGWTLAKGGIYPNYDDDCPPADGICVSDIFQYNLIPHGMGGSNVPGFSLKVNDDFTQEYITGYRTFLYNKDGTLPERLSMLEDKPLYYLAAPFGNVEKSFMDFSVATKGFISNSIIGGTMEKLAGGKDGKIYPFTVNRDACIPGEKTNHCPCIEWEVWDPENAVYKCKRQARCVAGNELHPRLDDDFSFCLTGSQGEPCKDDNDCRKGLQCVVVSGAGYTDKFSLFAKGVFDLRRKTSSVSGLLKDLTKVDGQNVEVYDLNREKGYAMQQMCMPQLSELIGNQKAVDVKLDAICAPFSGNASIVLDEWKLCKIGTGIKGGKPCEPLYDKSTVYKQLGQLGEAESKQAITCEEYLWTCFYQLTDDFNIDYQMINQNSSKNVPILSNDKAVYKYTASNNKVCYDYYSKLDADKIYNSLNEYVTRKWKTFYLFATDKMYNIDNRYIPTRFIDKDCNNSSIDCLMVKSIFTVLTEDGGGLDKTEVQKALLSSDFSLGRDRYPSGPGYMLFANDCYLYVKQPFDIFVQAQGEYTIVQNYIFVALNLSKILASGSLKEYINGWETNKDMTCNLWNAGPPSEVETDKGKPDPLFIYFHGHR